MSAVKIESVEITIGERTLILSIEDARDLYNALAEVVAPKQKMVPATEQAIRHVGPWRRYPRSTDWTADLADAFNRSKFCRSRGTLVCRLK